MNRNFEKEKLLLEYLISSTDIFAICSGIVKESYFINELKNTVKFINTYFTQYNALPDLEQISAETGVKLSKHQMTRDKIVYCAKEIEKFSKIMAMREAVMEAAEIAEKGSEEEFAEVADNFKNILTISVNKDLGIDFFNDDIQERIENRKQRDEKLPSGYKRFDDLLNGGPERKSIVIFCGVSGGGKSLTLQNFALNYATQGKTVLYISFELYQDMIDDRFMTMVSDLNSVEQMYRKQAVVQKISEVRPSTGGLHIKYLPVGSKTSDIRAYLKEFELHYNKIPDVVCVDYLDLLMPVMPVSAENIFLKDKFATEELRAIGVEYDFLTLTASQLNREAREATKIGHQHIAGGISKINTADVVAAVNINKKTGVCVIEFLKTRSSAGEGEAVFFKYNPQNLRIMDAGDNEQQAGLQPKNFQESLDVEEQSGKPDDFLKSFGIMTDEYD